jgi:uncharacterized coiled-coil protein SlyX
MQSLEERVRKLEARAAHNERQIRRTQEAIKSAAGHIETITAVSTLAEVINAIKSAAGQIKAKLTKGDDL